MRGAALIAVTVLAIAPATSAREMRNGDMVGLPPANVVILGEVHDNPQHHINQARAIANLHPKAVVFEMLTPEQAAIVNESGLQGDDLAAALRWDESGWPDFSLYAPVFDALGAARAYGMAVPRETVRRAMTEGAAAVFGDDAARYGLTVPLPAETAAARADDLQEAHCNALPPEQLPGMVEAQRLRDAAFSRTIIEAYDASGGPVVVITGSGHAREDWGIPAVLRKARPQLIVLSIGQLERVGKISAPPYTHFVATYPIAREDPCKAFGPADGQGG